jgi:hypothetical protein
VLVTFTPPVNDGGDPISLSTVTATPATGTPITATGQNSPISMNGLTNGTSYTFHAVAHNSIGDSVASTESTPLIAGVVPGAPALTSASREIGQSTVAFTPPASNGGLPITGYTVHAMDTIVTANGGQTVTGPASPLVITGLVDGDAYTFTVTATNDAGTSDPSASSALVIPGGEQINTPQAPYPNASSFHTTKRIGNAQFQDELQAVVHQTLLVTITIDNATSDSTIWIVPNTLDRQTVQTVIDNHVMDPGYGIPAYIADFGAVLQKVNNDPTVTLSSTDIQNALKGLLTRLSG